MFLFQLFNNLIEAMTTEENAVLIGGGKETVHVSLTQHTRRGAAKIFEGLAGLAGLACLGLKQFCKSVATLPHI